MQSGTAKTFKSKQDQRLNPTLPYDREEKERFLPKSAFKNTGFSISLIDN